MGLLTRMATNNSEEDNNLEKTNSLEYMEALKILDAMKSRYVVFKRDCWGENKYAIRGEDRRIVFCQHENHGINTIYIKIEDYQAKDWEIIR